jgi:hypothetical protein
MAHSYRTKMFAGSLHERRSASTALRVEWRIRWRCDRARVLCLCQIRDEHQRKREEQNGSAAAHGVSILLPNAIRGVGAEAKAA